jgi:uncharacterized protein (TIGR00369 family)
MEADTTPGGIPVTSGEFAGWKQYAGTDPFEDVIGPFYYTTDAAGRPRCAFRAEAKHMNGGGFMHGGCLMSFADYALFVIAREALGSDHGVTVEMNSTFLASGWIGDLVEATGEVVRAGGSLIFVRGQITSAERVLLTFSGIIKRVKPKAG